MKKKQVQIIDLTDVKRINPKYNASYSTNLYRWLTAPRRIHRAYMYHVYKSNNNSLKIGRIDDMKNFIGCNLFGVMSCETETEGCYLYDPKYHYTIIPDFWKEYIEKGRCCIDKEHQMCFMNDEARWNLLDDGNIKECSWCGRQMKKKIWTETIQRESWELI